MAAPDPSSMSSSGASASLSYSVGSAGAVSGTARIPPNLRRFFVAAVDRMVKHQLEGNHPIVILAVRKSFRFYDLSPGSRRGGRSSW